MTPHPLRSAIIKSKDTMNVLGVTFDSKLNWAKHVANQVSKSACALLAIKLIGNFFSSTNYMVKTRNHKILIYFHFQVETANRIQQAFLFSCNKVDQIFFFQGQNTITLRFKFLLDTANTGDKEATPAPVVGSDPELPASPPAQSQADSEPKWSWYLPSLHSPP